jgi:hypothetical protein
MRVPVPCDPVDHPVVMAWRGLGPPRTPIDRVDRLRKKKKAQIYRLGFVNTATSVIAKRGWAEQLLVERTIYESVLPRLALPTLRYYGFVTDEDDEFAWLFIEDAGDVPCSLAQHETVAGRWLGTLHGGAAALDLASFLPDRGPGHYLEHLRAVCRTVLGNFENPALEADDRHMLRALVSSCEMIESRWSSVEVICDSLPRTLVHGDLEDRNLRFKSNDAGTAIIAFDWEWSGWAVPAVDIYLLARDATRQALLSYQSATSEYADTLDVDQIRALSLVGKGFRLLASADWASTYLLHSRPEQGVGEMRSLEQPLREWGEGLAATA